METLQIISMTPVELQRMFRDAIQEAKKEWELEQKAPSEWEELTLEQAAAELKCSVRTIRRRMKEYKIKGYRVGREVTIQRKDLRKIRSASGTRES